MGSARHTLALCFALLCCACSDSAPRYNVLLITVDTTRADYVSCLGGDPRNTPNMDALAARSALFTNVASETNVTNPSHISILTGMRAIDHGVISNRVALSEDVVILPEYLGRSDYQTAGFIAVGHLRKLPGWKGFDKLPRVQGILDADRIADQGIRFLERRDPDRPFFLWTHFFDAHSLYEPPADIAAEYYPGDPSVGDHAPLHEQTYFQKTGHDVTIDWLRRNGPVRDIAYGRAMYSAEIHFMDREIGRLLEALDAQGLAENTIVVLIGDHGESLEEHGIWYDHKGLYEQQLRIPLIVHVPEMEPAVVDAFASTIDVVPTITAALGVPNPGPVSGISLLPAMRGDARALDERDTFVHQHAHNELVALRVGSWKLIQPVVKTHQVLRMVPQLFNLADDPGEEHNLIESEPERAAAMRRLLDPWIQLGEIPKGVSIKLTDDDLQALHDLGYAGASAVPAESSGH